MSETRANICGKEAMAALMEVTCNNDSDSFSEREMEREVTVESSFYDRAPHGVR